MAVKNLQNENLGKINDLVFDPESGRISYAVVSIGGVLGVGDKLIAVPVTSLRPQPGQKHLVLNMDKASDCIPACALRTGICNGGRLAGLFHPPTIDGVVTEQLFDAQ